MVAILAAFPFSLEFLDGSPNQGRKNPLDGVAPAVKAALTKAYKEARKTQMVRTADLITLPGIKKAPKKRIAAMLEPAEDTVEGNGGDALAESDDENSLDNDDTGKI